MPYLVREANKTEEERDAFSLVSAYKFAIPFGVLGFHMMYLKKRSWAVMYFFTCGLCGIGLLIDLIRMPWLVKEARQLEGEDLKEMDVLSREQVLAERRAKRFGTAECYLVWFPLGLLGMHHFYCMVMLFPFLFNPTIVSCKLTRLFSGTSGMGFPLLFHLWTGWGWVPHGYVLDSANGTSGQLAGS